MKLNKIVNGIAQSGDPGAYIRQEVEEGLSPITERVDRLEKKIDLLILTMQRIEEGLKKIEPLYNLLMKLPFFKK
jgi:tetrahydromethanopterin S-methyltransferase subunit B